jgi:hypothetical protein
MYRGIIAAALTVTDTTIETLRVTAVLSEMNTVLEWVRQTVATLLGGTAITTTTVSVTVSTPRRILSQIALAFIATKACGNDPAIEPSGRDLAFVSSAPVDCYRQCCVSPSITVSCRRRRANRSATLSSSAAGAAGNFLPNQSFLLIDEGPMSRVRRSRSIIW